MNTSALKRFAQQARNILISGVGKQLIYWGYDPDANQFAIEPQQLFGGMLFGDRMIDDPTVYPKWLALKKAVAVKGINQVVEEAAYTWFNRLMAIRILAKNNYIVPQLEYTGAATRTPAIVLNAKRGITPLLDDVQRKLLARLLDDDRLETDQFTLLITAYCHQNKLLQRVFGRLDDYTELLLPSDILAVNGFIDLLNTTDAITDEDYRQVELIGWLYQFYISEKKDEVFKKFKKKKKAEAEDIPAATQIFTPNWIVKYMVQNTVGRLWLDLNPDSRIRETMKYLVEPETEHSSTIGEAADGAPIISEVAQLKLLDPACGSGHILVEGFDLLYAMYREEGYSAAESVRSIFENNLFGLDIDQRATQLSNFALLLKAAAKDRTILDRDLLPHVYAMPEKDVFTHGEVLEFLSSANSAHVNALYNALELMQQSQNLGSIMKFTFSDAALDAIVKQTAAWRSNSELDLVQQDLWKRLTPYLQVLQVLTTKYEAVAANPPYMGHKNMNNSLKIYINSNYPKSKSDLFAVFIEVVIEQCLSGGIFSIINQQNWMFLSSYEILRKSLLQKISVVSLAQLGNNIFEELSGEVVQSVMFVFKNDNSIENGVYFKLDKLQNKENGFFNKINRYNETLNRISLIPRKRFAFWVSDRLLSIFSNDNLAKKYNPKSGVLTGKDALFVRNWYEVIYSSIDNKSKNYLDMKQYNYKWAKITNGGKYRKWYGNLYNIVNLKNEGSDIKSLPNNNYRLRNPKYYHKKGINWTLFLSGNFSVRISDSDVVFGNGSRTFFPNEFDFNYLMGLFNTKVVSTILDIYNPTTNFVNEDIADIPLIYEKDTSQINKLVEFNISISRLDWDSRETSWDFETHPLLKAEQPTLQSSYQAWETQVTQEFYQLHANETELNRIFIDIYGLQDELTPEVKLKDITILQEELDTKAFGDTTEPVGTLPIKQDVVMRQLISYLMGCLMGRYRLDKPGLHIAHPNPTAEETSAYTYNNHTVAIDEDGIVPLMDSSCSFADNALIRLKFLLEVQWGNDKQMVETINFMEAALGKDLETFLVKDFWKDHCSRYQKRPIYWLFASPKGAFQVITYMHRMNKYTIDKIRSKYLLVHIRNLENQLSALQADNASLNREQSKRMEKVRADLDECRAYDLLLKDVADQQIEFDLDEGVVVNYAKFAGVVVPIK
jgi:type II restriction/modification system DNA methylase subunit YeeA